MFDMRRARCGALAALFAVTVQLPILTTPAAAAPDAIDNLITGSINPGAPMPVDPKGSAEFRAALDLINSEPAKAYELASALPNVVERRTVQWAAISFGNGGVPYQSVLAFLKDAPGFAAAEVFKTRLEQALLMAEASSDEIVKHLGGAMPNTLEAQIALALAYVEEGETARAQRIAQAIWVGDYLDKASEDKVYKALGKLLTPADHWARAQHLMMHDRAGGVERLLPLLNPAQISLAVARNAVSRNASNAKELLDKVDPTYQTDPIYFFSRAQRARQFELWDDAIAYLDRGTTSDPDAEEWWYERRTLIRLLLGKSDVGRAYRAADGYNAGPEGRLVEARFHAGWIALSFLHDAASAERHFSAMTALSTLPDSASQAWYWLGRAEERLGKAEAAKQAYGKAAAYGMLYYGLLARGALGMKPVELRGMPSSKDSEAAFDNREIVRAIVLLAENEHRELATPLLRNFAQGLQDGPELALAARLAQRIGAHHLAISIADIADKRGAPLDLFSFPKDGLPSAQLAEIDKAAIYAITRQESRFQIDAVSSSGARGLMQLMPATAKETAKKMGVVYSQSKLTSDGAYNARLGSAYLADQLATFDGSLVLAAAAYNAGAGNASKWIAAFGDPRLETIDPVVWVELIPFQETRRYVQRVLGNYLVYRARLGHDDMTLMQALRRIS
ncbi:MAG: lytic transglycosylase domain-containing protein [Devosia sp.]